MSDWQTVPVEPTLEMLEALEAAVTADFGSDVDKAWAAALAAAPPPPAVRVTEQMVEAAAISLFLGTAPDAADIKRTPDDEWPDRPSINKDRWRKVAESALNAALAVSFPIQQDEPSKGMVMVTIPSLEMADAAEMVLISRQWVPPDLSRARADVLAALNAAFAVATNVQQDADDIGQQEKGAEK